MAKIIRIRGRKPLAEASPTCGMANYREDGGLTFRLRIADHNVILTHSEYDMVRETWERMRKDFEHGTTD